MLRDTDQVITEIITIALFSVFQYLNFVKDEEWGSWQSLIYCILSLMMMLALVWRVALEKQEMRKLAGTIDWFLLFLLILGIGCFLYKMFVGEPDIESELLLLAVPISSYVYSCRRDVDAFTLDLFLGTGIAIYVVLFLTLFYADALNPSKLVATDPESWFSWLLLSAISGIFLYSNTKDKGIYSVLGLFFSIVSFTLVLLYQNITLIYLTGFAVLLPCIAQKPDAEFLKRNLQLVFVWFAMLCNIRIFMEMAGLNVTVQLYSTGCRAFMEVTLVIIGLLLLMVWHNMPEDRAVRIRWLRKMRKGMLISLYLYSGFLILLLSGGVGFWNIQRNVWVNLADLSQEWAEERGRSINLFQSVYSRWGMVGIVFLGVLFAIILYQVGNRYQTERKNRAFRKQAAIFIPLGVLFMIQCFFWEVNAGTLPIYVWAISGALYSGKDPVPEEYPLSTEEIGT